AFLAIDPVSVKWFRSELPASVPSAEDVTIASSSASRVSATLRNPLTTDFRRLPVVIMVYDAEGNVISASSTVVPDLPPQGSAPLVFTWNAPFTATPSRIDIRAVLPVQHP